MGSKGYRGKRRKSPDTLAREKYLRDLSRRTAGSYNSNSMINVSSFYRDVGYGGTYFTTIHDIKAVSRETLSGNFISTTPYRRQVCEQKGSSFIGGQLFAVSSDRSWNPRLCREGSNPNAVPFGGYTFDEQKRADLLVASQNALVSKVRSACPTWDILTDAVELRESLGSLRSAARTISQLLVALGKRDVKRAMRILDLKTKPQAMRKFHMDVYGVQHYEALDRRSPVLVADAFNNLWMNYRYAVMPTVYSIQDAFKALAYHAETSDGECYNFTSQVTLTDSASLVNVSRAVPFFGSSNVFCDITTIYRTTGSVRKKAYYRFASDILDRLNPNTILTLCNTAWELVPYSWVFDWALKLGEYLQNLQLPSLVTDVDVCETHKFEGYVAESIGNIRTNLPSGWSGEFRITYAPGNGVCVSQAYDFQRLKGNLVVPDYSISQVFFSWKRQLDAACLSWQRARNHLSLKCRIRP